MAAYQWADKNDETAFQHVYPGGAAQSNRIEYEATPNPTGPNCKPDNPQAVMRMNAGDGAFNAYLYKNVWTGTSQTYDFPAPYGIMEDHASDFCGDRRRWLGPGVDGVRQRHDAFGLCQ